MRTEQHGGNQSSTRYGGAFSHNNSLALCGVGGAQGEVDIGRGLDGTDVTLPKSERLNLETAPVIRL